MRIKQGIVFVAYGAKETGKTGYQWFRISRRKLDDLAKSLSRLPNFYYAKVYLYKRIGKGKGYPIKPHVAFIYWDKEGFLTTKNN